MVPKQLQPYRAAKSDTVILAGLIALVALVQCATGRFSPTIEGVAPDSYLYACMLPFGAGSALVLLGTLWRGSNLAALQIEMVGRAMVVCPAIAYGALLAKLVGIEGAVPAFIAMGIGLSSAYRTRQIWKVTTKLHHDLVTLNDGGTP